jgi:sugar lactone lactonase YvrE
MFRTDRGAWTPSPPPPLVGPLAPNRALTGAELWPVPAGQGPEDIAIDGAGRIVSGLDDGRIVRWPTGGGAPELLGSTGGRPLGIEVDRDGSLVICDAHRGLLRLREGAREPEVMASASAGAPFRFTNNAAIARDGTIYFTDTSTGWGVDRYREDILAHRPLGRLFALAPGSREPRLVADGLYFANGVALAEDESFVAVAETTRYRILRVPTAGGAPTVLHDNLPGFPDNLSTSPRGTFWVPLPDLRNRALDLLLPHPRLRGLVARLPEPLQPQPERYGLVLEMGENGRILRALHDPTGRIAMITGAREHRGRLYLGSLSEPTVAVVTL